MGTNDDAAREPLLTPMSQGEIALASLAPSEPTAFEGACLATLHAVVREHATQAATIARLEGELALARQATRVHHAELVDAMRDAALDAQAARRERDEALWRGWAEGFVAERSAVNPYYDAVFAPTPSAPSESVAGELDALAKRYPWLEAPTPLTEDDLRDLLLRAAPALPSDAGAGELMVQLRQAADDLDKKPLSQRVPRLREAKPASAPIPPGHKRVLVPKVVPIDASAPPPAEPRAVEAAEHDYEPRLDWEVCRRCGMVRNRDKATPCRGRLPAIAPRHVEPREGAPLDVAELPDWWDAQRALAGKPDASTCAAELRRALADSRNTWLKLEALAKPAMYLNDRVDTSAEAYRAKVEALCAAIDAGAPEGEIDDARDALLAEHPEPDHD
jgi:soluble cytochrome b562